MPNQPDFDLQTVHRYFAANCFNKAWEFIDNHNRTTEEDLAMLQTAMASLWHWTQREDAEPKNLSVGYWQVSRVFALLGQAENARRYAEFSLKLAQGEGPFYIGFAYEALARAEMTAGNRVKMNEHLKRAREFADQVEDLEDKEVLMVDIGTME